MVFSQIIDSSLNVCNTVVQYFRQSLLHFMKWNAIVLATRSVDPGPCSHAEESCFFANYIEVLSAFRIVDPNAGQREHLTHSLPHISHHCDVPLLEFCPFPLPSGQWTTVMDNNRRWYGQFWLGSGTKGQISPGDLTAFLIKPHCSVTHWPCQ